MTKLEKLEKENNDLLVALRAAKEYAKIISDKILSNASTSEVLAEMISHIERSNMTLEDYDNQHNKEKEDNYLKNLRNKLDSSDAKNLFE